jgi:hypothetical protein
MPSRYDFKKHSPQTDAYIDRTRTEEPVIVTEYKADDERTNTNVASADTLKVILEAKLAMDYHIEDHKGGIATRVIAIAMNKKSIRVFLLEPHVEILGSKPVKKYHKLFYVPGIQLHDSVDVGKLVSLMLFSYEQQYWKLFNPKMQELEKKYRKHAVVTGTPAPCTRARKSKQRQSTTVKETPRK